MAEMHSDNYFRTYIGKPTCMEVGKAIAINRRSRPISKDSLIALMQTKNIVTEVYIYHIDTYCHSGEIDEECYDLMNKRDRSLVLGRLFDLSLTHNMVLASTMQIPVWNTRLSLFIAPTKDGQSNIDADVIEFIMNQGLIMNQGTQK